MSGHHHPATLRRPSLASSLVPIAGSGALGPGALGVVLCGSGSTRRPLCWRAVRSVGHSTELSSVCWCRFGPSAAVPRRPIWAFRVSVVQRGPAPARSRWFAYLFSRNAREVPLLKTSRTGEVTTWPVASRRKSSVSPRFSGPLLPCPRVAGGCCPARTESGGPWIANPRFPAARCVLRLDPFRPRDEYRPNWAKCKTTGFVELLTGPCGLLGCGDEPTTVATATRPG